MKLWIGAWVIVVIVVAVFQYLFTAPAVMPLV